MSTVLLTDHNENICNIIKKEDSKPSPKISAKPPFITKLLEAEEKRNKYCHKTFGFAEVPLNQPSEYLKKNSRIFPPCPKIEEPRCLLSQRLPKIPPCIQAAKKQKQQDKTFGKIPNYLHQRQLQADTPEKEKETEKNQFKLKGRYITQPERQALLQGLKHNREELQKAYQLLPILTDTITKKKHKIKLEEELKQLESGISTLERHPHIYVTDATCSESSYDPDSN